MIASPPKLPLASAAAPAATRPNPYPRVAWRRQPGASTSASPNSARESATAMIGSAPSVVNPSCASASWSERRISI